MATHFKTSPARMEQFKLLRIRFKCCFAQVQLEDIGMVKSVLSQYSRRRFETERGVFGTAPWIR
jgi:hypothetical protein